MPRTTGPAQRRYYEDTADRYDALHVHEGDEHQWGIDRLVELLDDRDARSLLDVGTGTGRVLRALAHRRPDVELHGIDPVPSLLEHAVAGGVDRIQLTLGSGTALPFADGSFDVVCAFGMLHHVPDPGAVVAEMLRVACRGIVISDINRFGRGTMAGRLAKLALARAGLWHVAFRLTHRGRPYWVSEGDGIAYSYSVYDDLATVAAWAAELQLLGFGPTTTHLGSWAYPLLTSSHVVLTASRRVPALYSDSGAKPIA